jgi:hypothetical protein
MILALVVAFYASGLIVPIVASGALRWRSPQHVARFIDQTSP